MTTARLLVVADGMGGHAHGEIASSITVAALTELDGRLPSDLTGVDLAEELNDALVTATDRLGRQAASDPETRGMGTTVVSLLLGDDELTMAHIGDSRIYLLRDGALTQLTRDHTMVQQLVDQGQITAEEALTHPRRSVLMKALSTDHPPEPDLTHVEILPGDRFLLCSDGVTAVLEDDLLREELGSGDPDSVVARLIEIANERGGPDNITAIVADVVETDGSTAEHDAEPRLVGAASEAITPG